MCKRTGYKGISRRYEQISGVRFAVRFVMLAVKTVAQSGPWTNMLNDGLCDKEGRKASFG